MFERLRKIFGSEETKSTVTMHSLLEGSFLEHAFSGLTAVSPRQAMQFYRSNSSVATAVDLLADSFEQITPALEIDGEFVDAHPVLALLKSPNGFDTWQEFAGKMSRNYLLTHNAHLTAIGGVKREPIEIWSNDPQWVSVSEASDKYPARYMLSQGPTRGHYTRTERARQKTRFFDGTLKELYHIMGFSSKSSELWGDSPLQAAAAETKQIIEGKNHNLKVLQNGGRLSLLVRFKDTLNDDQHKGRKALIEEQFGGSDNAGKIGVVSSKDMDIHEFGKTNKEMDYAKLESSAARAIFMRYRIPLALAFADAATMNNMGHAIELLYDWAVLPLTDKLFSGLSTFLLPRYGLDPASARITYDPSSINTLKRRMLDELEKRKKINIETTNELRADMPGREPVDGGEVIYHGATQVPLGEDPFEEDGDD